VDEVGVEAERDVVEEDAPARAPGVDAPLLRVLGEARQRGERVAPVEPEVAGEVVARAEGDADEGQVAVDAGRRHRAERAVAAGRAEHVGVRLLRERRQVVSLAEHVHADAESARRLGELLRRRRRVAGAWIDEEQRLH
jgi:hypothetical protein